MTGAALPAWAQQITPVDMDGAAHVLGVSRRFLIDVIKQHKHYERRGAKKVFYPEHIALLREKMSCPDSNSKSGKESTTPLAPSEESAFEKALALATRRKPKKSSPSTKHGSSNVIPMAKKP